MPDEYGIKGGGSSETAGTSSHHNSIGDRRLPFTSTSDLVGSTMASPTDPASAASVTGSRDGSISPNTERNAADRALLRRSIAHRWIHDQSTLCCIASRVHGLLFCGTQDSLVIVYDLDTFQEIKAIEAHDGSVLCMHLASDHEDVLITGGSDSLVKVWDIKDIVGETRQVSLLPTHTIYSLLDIGDIFSVTWVGSTRTVLFGAQNASISYIHLGNNGGLPADPSSMPSMRYDKFFDSQGHIHGKTLQSSASSRCASEGLPGTDSDRDDEQTRLIEVPPSNIISYAHNGYVYALQTISNIDENKSLLGGTIPEDFDDVILSGGGDGVVNIWGFLDNKMTLLRSLDNDQPVLCLATHEGENYCALYCGLADGSVNVWDLSTFQLIRSFEVDNGDINSLAVSGDLLFIGSEKGICKKVISNDSIMIWLPDPTSCLCLEAFYRDDTSYLVSTAMDNSLTLWNVSEIDQSLCNPRSDTESSSASTTRMLEVLQKMVSFQTVSKQPSKYMDQSRQCASYLRLLFKNLGASKSVLLPVKDANPVVMATFQANKKKACTNCTPRILWYGHYDVIDADHTEAWDTDAFEVTPVNGYLYGRGTSDNKGPTLAAIYAVAELYKAKELEADAVFLIEGEEESGSYGFQDAVKRNKDVIGEIDWVLLSNSYWLDDNIPCLNYGLRGVVAATVEVFSDKPDRHSGVDGGVSREPTIDLINILSKLNDESGKVRLPNFYSTIRPMSERETSLYEDITKRVKGVELNQLMTKWRLPSLTVHRVNVSGPGNSTVIPHAATATLSIRLVPNQDLSEIKESLVGYLKQCFDDLHTTNHLTIKITHEAEPWLADTNNAAYRVLYKNLREAWEKEPLFIREGGSIPSIRFLEKTFDCEAAHLPTGQSSDNAHLNNERLRITNLFKAKEIWTKTVNKLPCKGSREAHTLATERAASQ